MISFNNEKALLPKLIAGNTAAFKYLYDKYKNPLYTLCFRITKSEEWSEKIVHDVFLKVWIEREKVDVQLAFREYLFQITKNASLNFIKKTTADPRLRNRYLADIEKYSQSSENVLICREAEELVNTVIDKMPPEHQSVFRMCPFDDLSHAEILRC